MDSIKDFMEIINKTKKKVIKKINQKIRPNLQNVVWKKIYFQENEHYPKIKEFQELYKKEMI